MTQFSKNNYFSKSIVNDVYTNKGDWLNGTSDLFSANGVMLSKTSRATLRNLTFKKDYKSASFVSLQSFPAYVLPSTLWFYMYRLLTRTRHVQDRNAGPT